MFLLPQGDKQHSCVTKPRARGRQRPRYWNRGGGDANTSNPLIVQEEIGTREQPTPHPHPHVEIKEDEHAHVEIEEDEPVGTIVSPTGVMENIHLAQERAAQIRSQHASRVQYQTYVACVVVSKQHIC